MSDLRFDGKVAIVTGAGGNPGLGRSYAMFLASRGAKVVVNDLGVGPDGHNNRAAKADLVVQEIIDAGGEAVADQHSVSEEDSARAVVQTALDEWGRVDILVNNAGVVTLAEFCDIPSADLRNMIDVHLYGNIWMCRAAWPHMREQGYGRIINISSGTSAYGLRHTTIYGAAKGGILSFTRGLAVEGEDLGIKVNSVGPGAETGAIQFLTDEEPMTPPELVAPIIGVLGHEDCPVSGHYFECAGGRTILRSFVESTGYTNPELTAEDLLEHLDDVLDLSDHVLFPEPLDNDHRNDVNPRQR